MARPVNKAKVAPNRKGKAEGKQPIITTATTPRRRGPVLPRLASPPSSPPIYIKTNPLSVSQKRQYLVFADDRPVKIEAEGSKLELPTKTEDGAPRRSSRRSSLGKTTGTATTTDADDEAPQTQRKLKTNFGPRKSTTRKAKLVAAWSSEEIAVELPKQMAEDGDDEFEDEDDEDDFEDSVIVAQVAGMNVVEGKKKTEVNGKPKATTGSGTGNGKKGKTYDPNWFAPDTSEPIIPSDANMADAPPTPHTHTFEISGPAISSTVVTTTTITTTTKTTRNPTTPARARSKAPATKSTNAKTPVTKARSGNNRASPSSSTRATRGRTRAPSRAPVTKAGSRNNPPSPSSSTRATRGSTRASSRAPPTKRTKTR
ncbi:hypothetical protein K440DRAFT_661347 [Wilcoxina mikolae CBS 423.85]|nr:hypothetical protein K440DRAFT_661347 [Wilcoxina mikolae CBS 423.85]